MIASVIALALSQAASGLSPAEVTPDRGVAEMTRAEIRAYNDRLERNHPAYIRCDRRLETGSLVKKVTTCRTNEEWRRVETVGNDDARDIVDRVNSSGSSNSLEPAGSIVSPIGG